MPICEADPWRLQYFAADDCPEGVRIPTEDADAWSWNPKYRWVYDKLAIALSQGLRAAPHGVAPPSYPVFSKPIVNLSGMGIGSRDVMSEDDYKAAAQPGHFWMDRLAGDHVSTDVAIAAGKPVWWRHTTGVTRPGGAFDRWIVHAEPMPALEAQVGAWIERHLAGYSGMVNLETIGGGIIEVHLRFADQWPDLYGPGWVRALIGLYATGQWHLPDEARRTGFSVVLFGPHGRRYRHPPADLIAALRQQAGVSSVQITFHEDRAPDRHAMPPGGFRLGIVNCTDLDAGRACRARLRQHFDLAEEGAEGTLD